MAEIAAVQIPPNMMRANPPPARRFEGFVASISQGLHELVDPFMKLVMDIVTALLLGVFFVVQSIMIVISLDLILAAMFRSLQIGVVQLMSLFSAFLTSEREKKALGNTFIEYGMNFILAHLITHVAKEASDQFFYSPAVGHLVILLCFAVFTARLESNLLDRGVKMIMVVLLIGQTAMFYATIQATLMEHMIVILFLLRSNIDMFGRSLELMIKATFPFVDMDNSSALYFMEISRRFMWLTLTVLQMLTLEKQDRGTVLLIIAHDFKALCGPLYKLMMKINHDRYIANRFPRLSSDELQAVREEKCAVCLCEHNHESLRLRCSHILHSSCLNRVMQTASRQVSNRCPICRASISEEGAGGAAGGGGGGGGVFNPNRGPQQGRAMRDMIRVRIITQGLFPIPGGFGLGYGALGANINATATTPNAAGGDNAAPRRRLRVVPAAAAPATVIPSESHQPPVLPQHLQQAVLQQQQQQQGVAREEESPATIIRRARMIPALLPSMSLSATSTSSSSSSGMHSGRSMSHVPHFMAHNGYGVALPPAMVASASSAAAAPAVMLPPQSATASSRSGSNMPARVQSEPSLSRSSTAAAGIAVSMDSFDRSTLPTPRQLAVPAVASAEPLTDRSLDSLLDMMEEMDDTGNHPAYEELHPFGDDNNNTAAAAAEMDVDVTAADETAAAQAEERLYNAAMENLLQQHQEEEVVNDDRDAAAEALALLDALPRESGRKRQSADATVTAADSDEHDDKRARQSASSSSALPPHSSSARSASAAALDERL